ncbi:lysis protein [Symbiopectobacterium purcellii]|uniref:lysis protein n=1 Tax=Symbiopectobacterium purcellii TaxID=2871826 RepID=UPI003F8252BF
MHWKIPVVIAALLASMTGAALYYRALYLNAEKDQQYWEAQTQSQQAALAQLHRQMQTVAALDAKHTRELENDKNRIAQLERDVADGRRRLQVRAVCPGVSANSASSRLDDAARPGLTDAAQRNYFTLRRRIEIANRQINSLQDYVRQVCLNSHSGE